MERKGKNRGEFERDVDRNLQRGSSKEIDQDPTRRATEGTTGGQQGTGTDETTRRTEQDISRSGTDVGKTGTNRETSEGTRQAGSSNVDQSGRSGSSRQS